ncbi:MAG: PEGA domain-containing protein [Myxococcota bacterium]
MTPVGTPSTNGDPDRAALPLPGTALCQILLALVTWCGAEVPATAQGPEDGRESFEAAMEASADGRYAEAVGLFRRSLSERDLPETRLNLAVLLEELGQGMAALREIDAIRSLPSSAVPIATRRAADDLRSRILQSTGQVVLELEPGDAEVRIDGAIYESRDLALTAGEHRVRIEAPGYVAYERTITVERGVPQSIRVGVDRAVGRVSVTSHPDARVVIEGIGEGRGSLTLPAPVGLRTVRAELEEEFEEREIRVIADEVIEVNMPLRESGFPWGWIVGASAVVVVAAVTVPLLLAFTSLGQSGLDPNPATGVIEER